MKYKYKVKIRKRDPYDDPIGWCIVKFGRNSYEWNYASGGFYFFVDEDVYVEFCLRFG